MGELRPAPYPAIAELPILSQLLRMCKEQEDKK